MALTGRVDLQTSSGRADSVEVYHRLVTFETGHKWKLK